ncbi:ATP-binding protein [Streptomyces sp. KLOTTS4A1]|uniref:ATP-binding protein n=1 Tax=Streptomyces sp. KLOTTS4A1 TaxID=3390996 RepID=UPI0039F53A78
MKQQIADQASTRQHAEDEGKFVARLGSSRTGARLARRLAVQQLSEWGVARGSDLSERVALVVGELAANAATHGRSPGRDFRLTLMYTGAPSDTPLPRTLRIEVTDTRPDRRPPEPDRLSPPDGRQEGGRGLLIVDALADHWGCTADGTLTKTVWAEVAGPGLERDGR